MKKQHKQPEVVNDLTGDSIKAFRLPDGRYVTEKLAKEIEESASDDLEEAAEEWEDTHPFSGPSTSFIAGAKWQKEQKPELVQHPPITYTYPSDASRDEQLKRAILALLNSDLIKVVGNKFTKQDLIEWVEKQKPAEDEK